MALTNFSYNDDDIYVSVHYNGGLTTAFITHTMTGIYAKAHAKHNVVDVYDQVFGSDLAIARAKARLYNKIQKQLAKGAV